MRNLGVFFPVTIPVKDLANMGSRLGGVPVDASTQQFGEIPEAAYLDLATDLANACFDDDELDDLQLQLGFTPAAYVSVHMSSTKAAFERALLIARTLSERWSGKIDYSGAGGRVDQRFRPPD
jgi:hypothetical protein